MGARTTTRRDLAEELARVKRHIDQALLELADARSRMTFQPVPMDADRPAGPRESELATLCISLDLALADSVASAQRLADKVRKAWKPLGVPASNTQ
jgi:hypothetical protein